MKHLLCTSLLLTFASTLACDGPQDSHSGKAPTGMIDPGPDAPSRAQASAPEAAVPTGGVGGGGAGGAAASGGAGGGAAASGGTEPQAGGSTR